MNVPLSHQLRAVPGNRLAVGFFHPVGDVVPKLPKLAALKCEDVSDAKIEPAVVEYIGHRSRAISSALTNSAPGVRERRKS